MSKKTHVIMILDGYGLNPIREHNAVALANTPVMDKLEAEYGISFPEYTEGSLSDYLQEVSAIAAKLKWTITTECKIGLFSFLKIFLDYRQCIEKSMAIAMRWSATEMMI